MKTPEITFVSQGKAELTYPDIPALRANDVQVLTEYSTISNGTEKANLAGDKSLNCTSAPTEAQYPRTVGYSAAGVVTAIGENVTRVKVGDRVALAWCKHRRVNVLDEKNVFKIPDTVSTSEAALLHIATFPLAAIRKCQLELGESAIVMGLGVLGMFAVSLLRVAGATPIIAVDPIPEKRAQALLRGADYALDPYAEDFADTVKSLTNGGVNVAIEVTGVGKALDSVLDCMAKFGRVALLGCTRNSDFTIDYYRKVHGPGITLIGAHTIARPKFESHTGWWTLEDDMNALINLTHTKRLCLGNYVEEIHSPTEATEVFDRLLTERGFPLVQFDWREMQCKE